MQDEKVSSADKSRNIIGNGVLFSTFQLKMPLAFRIENASRLNYSQHIKQHIFPFENINY